jgi:hypothetical protein
MTAPDPAGEGRPDLVVHEAVVSVPIRSLRPADSPRLVGEDPAHARNLAEVETGLPPILVHRSSRRVIDGMHRLQAAALRGDATIPVRFVEGSEEEAFLLAVRENVAHGLPLSRADREAAASRILGSHPLWSNRAIAEVTGVGAGTVGRIRRSTGPSAQSNERRGRDGRVRPVSGADGRRRASEVVAARPDASVRRIAREAGVSLGTAQDVRDRMAQGVDPLLPGQRADLSGVPPPRRRSAVPTGSWPEVRQELHRDPTVRYTQAGRALLRWLGEHALGPGEARRLARTIPPHWVGRLAAVARQSAREWQQLADELDQRERDSG